MTSTTKMKLNNSLRLFTRTDASYVNLYHMEYNKVALKDQHDLVLTYQIKNS